MSTVITIVVLFGALVILALCLILFTYPEVLVKTVKLLFVRPVKALTKVGHHKAVAEAVKGTEAKTDTVHLK